MIKQKARQHKTIIVVIIGINCLADLCGQTHGQFLLNEKYGSSSDMMRNSQLHKTNERAFLTFAQNCSTDGVSFGHSLPLSTFS